MKIEGLRKFIVTVLGVLIGLAFGVSETLQGQNLVWYFGVVLGFGNGSNVAEWFAKRGAK